MAKQVQRWQSKSGEFFDSEYEALKCDATGSHECPACHGFGTTNTGDSIYKMVYDEESTAWGGMFASPVCTKTFVGYQKAVCEVCNGEGFTVAKMRPVTETKVVGWE